MLSLVSPPHPTSYIPAPPACGLRLQGQAGNPRLQNPRYLGVRCLLTASPILFILFHPAVSPAHTATLALSSQSSDPTSHHAHLVRACASYVSPPFPPTPQLNVLQPSRCFTPRPFESLVFLYYSRMLVLTRSRTMSMPMRLRAYTYTIKSSKTLNVLSVSVFSDVLIVSIGRITGVPTRSYCSSDVLAYCVTLSFSGSYSSSAINRIMGRVCSLQEKD